MPKISKTEYYGLREENDRLWKENEQLRDWLEMKDTPTSEITVGDDYMWKVLLRIIHFGSNNIPKRLMIPMDVSGYSFGIIPKDPKNRVGIAEEQEGNVAVFGTNGSSKTRSIVLTSLLTYMGIIIGFDPKDELAGWYQIHVQDKMHRKVFKFGPSNRKLVFDIYYKLRNGENKVQCANEIAYAIIPKPLDSKDGYWIDMARNLQAAIIIFCFDKGYDFSETMLYENTHSVTEIVKKITSSGCTEAKCLISDIAGIKEEQLCSIATEMKRYTAILATDQDIQRVFSINNLEEGAEVFSWNCTDTREAPNVFLSIEQHLLEEWSGVLRVMLTQLIRHLERRPDKFSPEGCYMNSLMLLLDEFPLLGKMDVVTNAVTTLRSRKVTFLLVLQSLAQLDAVYGADVRKILLDNCQYKVILNVTEPDSQQYFSRLIGEAMINHRGASANFGTDGGCHGYGVQIQETKANLIPPEMFAMNNMVWIHSPYGFVCCLKISGERLKKLINIDENDRRWHLLTWYR